jgi:hypothetical protein
MVWFVAHTGAAHIHERRIRVLREGHLVNGLVFRLSEIAKLICGL